MIMSSSELACSCACLLLNDDGIPITGDKISTVVDAAGLKVESYWPGLFAKPVQKRGVDDLITNVGCGGGGAPLAVSSPAAGASGAPAAAAPATEEKEEPKEESDDDMGFSLFD